MILNSKDIYSIFKLTFLYNWKLVDWVKQSTGLKQYLTMMYVVKIDLEI